MTNVLALCCTSFMTNVPPLYVTHQTVDDNGARVVIADDTNVFVLLLHFKHAVCMVVGLSIWSLLCTNVVS